MIRLFAALAVPDEIVESLVRRQTGLEGARCGNTIGTYLHGPLLPRNPHLADWLLAQALAHRTGGEPPELAPLADELETEAMAVSAQRARDQQRDERWPRLRRYGRRDRPPGRR